VRNFWIEREREKKKFMAENEFVRVVKNNGRRTPLSRALFIY
jgi:hypothetical protein